VVWPVTPPSVAVTVVLPDATPVANPVEEMVATLVELEDQVATPVRSVVVPSEFVPMAVNCWVAPTLTVAPVGVTAIELSVAELTVMNVCVKPCS
jgi:hypothetical protein